MPASEFTWSAFSTPPIFQMYGTKRKASGTDSEAMMTSSHNHCESQHVATTKRRCDWPNGTGNSLVSQPSAAVPLHLPQTAAAAAAGPADEGMEVNHNGAHMHDQQLASQQATHPALSHVMSQQPPRVPSPWPSHQPINNNNNNNNMLVAQDVHRIMDINDELLSSGAVGMGDTDAVACAGMDSDFVPNPQQYQHHSQENSFSSAHCDQLCGMGDEASTSGRVRCYCKPSWEGMMDLKPYISDVY